MFILSGQLQVVAHSGRISAMNPLVAFYVEHNMLKKVNNATEFVSIKFKGIKMNVTNLYNFFCTEKLLCGERLFRVYFGNTSKYLERFI